MDSTDFNTSSLLIPLLNAPVSLPAWEALAVLTFLPLIIVGTVVGNILVIISVFTYPPLKITPNYFIVSLSMADLTVAIFVLPFNVIHLLTDRWLFAPALCKMWLTADVLCCTASILNLCAIALDRYQALHDPIQHAQRRTVRYVITKIFFVWLISCLICLPPILGWNDWPEVWTDETPCKLTEERGYVVYSSMGSFFIPLAVIIFVYYRIFMNTKQRLRKRAKASNLTVLKRATRAAVKQEAVETVLLEEPENGRAATLKIKNVTTGEEGSQLEDGKSILAKENINPLRSSKKEMPNGDLKLDLPSIPPEQLEINSTVGIADHQSSDQVYQFINEKAKLSLAKERKAARTMTIIVSSFVGCWLPFFLMYVIMPFCQGCEPSSEVVQFITWLGYMNSLLNPLIYTIFNLDFRIAFSRIMTGKICHCSRN